MQPQSTLPKRSSRLTARRQFTAGGDSSYRPVVSAILVGLAVIAGIYTVAIQFGFLVDYPITAFAIFIIAFLAGLLRVTAAAIPTHLSLSMGPLALAVLYTGPETAWATYGLWLIGGIIACALWNRRLFQLGFCAMLSGIAGAVQTAVRIYYPGLAEENQLGIFDSHNAEIIVSVILGIVTAVLLGGLVMLWQTRVSIVDLTSGVGLSRLVGVIAAQSVGAMFAHQLSLRMLGSILPETSQGLFQASVASTVVALTVAGLLITVRRQLRLVGRERALLTSLAQIPWPADASFDSQLSSHLKSGFPGVGISVVSVDEKNPPPVTDGRHLVSENIMTDDGAVVGVVRRKAFGKPFTNSDRRYLEAIASLAQESVLARREVGRLRSLYNTDGMTGLPNYTALRARLSELQEHESEGGLSALLFLSVQNLNVINRDFSPQVGDQVLRVIAERLLSITDGMPSAEPYRIAGNEFGILLVDLESRRDAERLAWRIDSDVSLPVDSTRGLVAVALAQTVAFAESGQKNDLAALVARADEQMYRAQRKFINVMGSISAETNFVGVDGNETLPARLPEKGPSAALIKAVREDRLTQVYQPIIDRTTCTIVGLEATVRYTDPVYGSLPPDFLTHEAERLGLRTKMAVQVMQHAMADMIRFRSLAPELIALRLNISPAQLVDREFTTAFEELREANPDIRIHLELDATDVRVAPDETTEQAAQYALEHDVLISLDEYGTEYSEFKALIMYPVSSIKMSREVLGSMRVERVRKSVAKHLNALENLDVRVLMQGVSTVEEIEMLNELGIRYAKGPLYGNPISASEMLVRLTTMGVKLS